MIREPRNLPPPQVPVIDGKSGLMSRDWYDYFREADAAMRALVKQDAANAIILEDFELRITDLETP